MAELSTLGAVIKPAYEGEANTNAFTDAEKSKIAGIEAGRSAGARVIGVTNHNAIKDPMPGTILTIDTWSKVSYERLLSLLA